MEFEGALPCLVPLVILFWAVFFIREKSVHKTWLDNLFGDLLFLLSGGLLGLPRLLSFLTMAMYNNGILIKDRNYVIVYNGIPFIGDNGGFFILIGELLLIGLFFFGLFSLPKTVIRRVKGDKSYLG